ncbi:hypothetical protein FIBSPDRAFT_970241 [Athelia psychrophila]|uniref:Uncharacterized protein n=1 Tax=Athelia psychrophila TaxID=1759441 RepID=A0A167SU05_9AGAM|nr:hypothetical protein FIBSPDRAFT_970241 [Fibularhizoctonia sp. CBS 109695]
MPARRLLQAHRSMRGSVRPQAGWCRLICPSSMPKDWMQATFKEPPHWSDSVAAAKSGGISENETLWISYTRISFKLFKLLEHDFHDLPIS